MALEEIAMRNMFAKVLLGVVIATAGAAGADNSLGTWKLNLAKSKFTPNAPVKSLTTTREATAEGGVKITTTGEQADGTQINSMYTAKYDGTESPVTGAPWDTVSIKQVNANKFAVMQKKSDGKYQSTGTMVISNDGKTATSSSKGTRADGKPFRYTMVWDKQAGDQSGTDATISTHSSPPIPAKPKTDKK
jgi:hypothetical protein